MINELDIAKPVKGTSWTDLILAIGVGESKPFPYDKQSTIRPLISGRVALMQPEWEYGTEKGEIEGESVLIVKRVK